MKNDKLLRLMADIDDEFIIEAAGTEFREKQRKPRRTLWAACIAAVLIVTLTISAFAAETFLGSGLMKMLKDTPWNKSDIRYTAVPDYTEPVKEEYSGALKVTETYYDGDALLLGVTLTLDKADENIEEIIALFDVKYYSGDTELRSNGYKDLDVGMYPVSENSYFGSIMVYPKERGFDLGLPDDFKVEISIKYLYGTNMSAAGEKIKVDQEIAPVSCEVSIDREHIDKYSVEETDDGCVLHSITVSPLWTDVDVTLETPEATSNAIVLVCGSDGEWLQSLQLYGSHNNYQYVSRRYRTPDIDETALTVKVYADEHKYDVGEALAEFTVPIDGGYYE